MCGIAGYLRFDNDPVSPVTLRRMTDAIAHRGPDGEGFFTDGPFAVGHRRLAIIDPTPAGHQPMASPDGRYVLSYNGEVYNYQELRLELEALGCWFNSNCDSEVVLRALEVWGTEGLIRFNGMFAFAFWDRVENRLVLGRDRYGIKPLYYSLQSNCLIFGSEVKAILAHPDYSMDIDREGLLEYFTFQNFLKNRTLYKGVSILSPGTYATCSQSEKRLRSVSYWDFQFETPDIIKDEREYEEELIRLFRQAVNRQLISDVEVGSYLSGGMDSGSITAVASSQLNHMKTFTVGFDLHSASGIELGCDEREVAEHMSYLFQTEHYEMVLKAGDMERVIPSLTYHLEEPRVGQSYPNYYAAKLASKFVKVVLGGTGGDELFGGYPWRYYRAAESTTFEQYINEYYQYWQRLLPNSRLRQLFAPIWSDVSNVWTRDIFRDVFASHKNELSTPADYINHSLYFELKTFLHGLLVVEDKLSMAQGLESRVPFLDNDLVAFAMRLPPHFKLGRLDAQGRINENEPRDKKRLFYETHGDGKLLLRKAMQDMLPSEITGLRKQGFSAPDATWFKGESLDYVRRRLFNTDLQLYNFIDRSAVASLVEEHLTGICNRRLLIWSLLSTARWCEEFLS